MFAAVAPSAVLLAACAPGEAIQAGLSQVSPIRTTSASPTPGSGTGTSTAPTDPRPSVSALATGWGQAHGHTWVTAVLRNSGDGSGASAVEIIAYGSGGRVLAFGGTAAVQVAPGQETAVGTLLDVPGGERVHRLETAVRTTPLDSARSVSFTLAGVNVQMADPDQTARLRATVTTNDPSPAMVTAVCYDAAGDIIGGGAAGFGSLPAGGLRAFAVDPLVVPSTPARCAVYPAVPATAN